MSYCITVTLFPARDRTNAFAVAKNLTTHVNRHKKDIIAQNRMAMPSIREAGRASQDILREWDRDWAFSLLAQKFLFYPKYQLLTRIGSPFRNLSNISIIWTIARALKKKEREMQHELSRTSL